MSAIFTEAEEEKEEEEGGEDALYLVFKGSDELIDWIINLGFVPTERTAHGLRVHGAMDLALHNRGADGADVLEAISAALKAAQLQSGRRIPLFVTGHSLGGGFAALASLEMHHSALKARKASAGQAGDGSREGGGQEEWAVRGCQDGPHAPTATFLFGTPQVRLSVCPQLGICP